MKYIITIISTLLLLSACEDVIPLKTETVDNLLSVDAWITTESKPQTIRLTYANGYFDNTTAKSVQDASVRVTNKTTGTTYEFAHTDNGVYTWTPDATNTTLGTVGDKFEFSLTHSGEDYTAASYVGRVPVIDSIVQRFEDRAVGDDGIEIRLFARDVPGLGDAYWIKTYKNDILLNKASELNISFDGSTSQSAESDNVIFIPPIQNLLNPQDEDGGVIHWQETDKARIEIHSITTDAFDFLRIARDQIQNSNSGIFASPLANARSNIKNAKTGDRILGFFNVSAVVAEEKIIE